MSGTAPDGSPVGRQPRWRRLIWSAGGFTPAGSKSASRNWTTASSRRPDADRLLGDEAAPTGRLRRCPPCSRGRLTGMLERSCGSGGGQLEHPRVLSGDGLAQRRALVLRLRVDERAAGRHVHRHRVVLERMQLGARFPSAPGERDHEDGQHADRGQDLRAGAHRSNNAAWPWPTPTHIVATP